MSVESDAGESMAGVNTVLTQINEFATTLERKTEEFM